MKRLSQTWRQKAKLTEKTSKFAVTNNCSTPMTGSEGIRRRSQRLTKKDEGSPNSNEQCSELFNSSFGFDFDTQVLSVMEKIEQEHTKKKGKPLPIPGMSPIIPITPPGSSLPFANTNTKNVKCDETAKLSEERCPSGKPLELPDPKAVNVGKTFHGQPPNIRMSTTKTHIQEIFEEETSNEGTSVSPKVNLLGSEQKKSNKQEPNKKTLMIETSSKEAKLTGRETSTHDTSTQSSSQSCLTQEQCELSSWGIPNSLLEQYKKIGITTMFEWQAQCLRTGNVLNGGNLVYSAPTSAGKTMVAEILILKRILETKCKAMFILPFVSVAREKMFYLQRMFGEAGIKVDGYMGSQIPTKGFDSIDIAVCTIEKANGLVNRLMEDGQLHNVGAIVVDEMHLIGDTSRGYLLELLLTKVLYMSQSAAERNVQIIGMSATLPNLDVLATWLRADLYFTDYRPVPLTETFKVGPVIYDRSGKVLRELSQSLMVSGDDDHILGLCQETVQEGNGVLVFCPTKSWCEKLAESIAKHFYTLGCAKTGKPNTECGASSLVTFNYDALRDIFEQLRSCHVGLDNVLGKTLRYGVAYHHAGLTYDERDIIEAGFRHGIIKVLVATSTLSSGVNLPARRVIIRTPIFYGKLMDALVYKQMSGRAGRKGVDSQGESILICKTNERQKARSLIEDQLKPVESCLVVKRSDEDEGNGIKRALLEVIASGVAVTPADVQRYASCTFYVSSKAQGDGDSTQTIITNTVGYLEKNEFITLKKQEDSKESSSNTESYVPTQLGQATLASSLSPDEALVVFADLRKARKCFVLENELHILYQVTPIYVQDQWPNLDWYQYLRLWEHLPSHMKRVSELVGVEERFLNRAMRNRPPTRSEAQRHSLRVHKRFYVTLALHDLVHEVPLDTVARKYGASRGMLQSLQSSAATFAGMVTVFCRKLGWNNLEMLLSQFQNRLSFGIERELCDLVRISALNAFRARVLYSAGYHTVATVAAASHAEVEKHIRNATPFQSSKKSEGESDYELRRRMRAKCVWVNDGKALTEAEAAQEIVKEACALVKEDALKLGIIWKPGVTVSNDSKTVTNSDVCHNQKVDVASSDGQEESSKDVQACKVTEPETRQETPATCGNTSTATSLCPTTSKSIISSKDAVMSLLTQMDVSQNENVTKNIPFETPQIPRSIASSTEKPNLPPNQPLSTTCSEKQKHAETSINLRNQMDISLNRNVSKTIPSDTPQIPRSIASSTEKHNFPPNQPLSTTCSEKQKHGETPINLPNQMDVSPNRDVSKNIPSETTLFPRSIALCKGKADFPRNQSPFTTCSAEKQKHGSKTKEKDRETPKKKRDASLKRKHSMSKSSKDCHGPKVKLMDREKTPGISVKQMDNPESVLDSQILLGSKSDQKDNFYADCLDNFKMKEHVTPTKRKARGVLRLETSPVTQKGPSRKEPTNSNSKKSSNAVEKSNQLQATAKFSSESKTPKRKNSSSNNSVKKQLGFVAENQPESDFNINNPTSEVAPNIFPGNPAFSNTKTPTGKQIEVQDESPELITGEIHNNMPTQSKLPFTEIEYKTTSPDLLVVSPELYSEALFPVYESPRDKGSEMQENLDTSVQGIIVSIQGKDKKIIEDNDGAKSKVPDDELHTPCRAGNKISSELHDSSAVNQQIDERPEEDITNLVAICTPGMFDSEMSFSEVPLGKKKSPEAVSTHSHSPERYRENTEQPVRNPEVFQPTSNSMQTTPKQSKQCFEESLNSLEKFKASPEQSRRSSDSFSLRLSQSFESASDSDLSARTLAAVAALEKQEMIAENSEGDKRNLTENQDNKQNLMDIQGKEEHHTDNKVSEGSQRFQEVSNISLLTLAAIEAMDEELRQNPAFSHEQRKEEKKSACTSDESRLSCPANEKRFTGIKQCNLPAKPAVSTISRSQIKLFETHDGLKKSHTGSNLPFSIIDITKDRDVFETFIEDCKINSFSFSVALEKRQPSCSTIGRKFNKGAKRSTKRQMPRLAIEADNLIVVGVAVCWENRKVYYLSLEEETNDQGHVPWEMRIDSFQKIMEWHRDDHVKIAFGVKEQYKVLSQACGVVLKGELQDPKIAAWLLDPEAKEKSFLQMVEHFLPPESNLLQGMVSGCGYVGLGLATQNSVSARERSCLDAVFTRMLIGHIRPMLEADGLWEAFKKIEMPVVTCLARMELNGFGFSNSECEQIKHVLRAKLRVLQEEAYRLANQSFSLTSPEEVSRVLFLELKLPPDGHADVSTSPGKAVRPTRGGKRRKVKYFSTSKDVLEKLTLLHPLPNIILEWRRINSALTKIVFPVQKEQVPCDPPLSMSRIFPTALTHTATGRVSFVEPNLQNVPRDFDINLPTVISDTPPTESLVGGKRKKAKEVYVARDDIEPSSPGPQFSVSLRSAFIPFSNGTLLAADYSQLELRLIAHLSSDGKLASFLNAGGDAFRMIAGEIFHIAQDRISDEQRQRAKHVCYGIIYGIGAKALGQTLRVDENEAALFVDAFKARFTGVRAYLKTTVDECRRLGYVTTISGRKRYLPNIRSSNSAARAHAERQAVNTTVQGSAADLVKLAMANIDHRLCEQFTNCWRTHRQKSENELGARSSQSGKRRERKFRGANLVLQLHDELLFEVVEQDLSKVVGIVRKEMENAMKLSVKIPVKMKTGKSWGTMVPIE